MSLPIAPVVAAQPVVPESTPVPLPGKSDIMLVVLGVAVVLITIIIGVSNKALQSTRKVEKVRALKQLVGGWRGEKVVLTPCNGATPSESRIRQIRTCGSMRERRS